MTPSTRAFMEITGLMLMLGGCRPPEDPVRTSGSEGSGSTGESTAGPSDTGEIETVDSTGSICGDGIVDDDEDCDDRGESATCDADCTRTECGDGYVNPMAGEQCDDAGESATCNVDCSVSSCGDGLTNSTAGEGCDDMGESMGCNADCSVAACGDGVVNGAAGEICDTIEQTAQCDADCTEVVCGDGLANAAAGEGCDDGGQSATCDVDCTAAECGDGVFNAMAGEACDEAGRTPACDEDCTLVACGDGIVNTLADEECDDGGESVGCNSNCTISACGDGITNGTAGESCDDQGESASCNADCTDAACGDGLLNPTAGEQCDGADVAGTTCELLGFNSGTLACDGGCTFDTGACSDLPAVPTLNLAFSSIKQFDFSWAPALGATYYQLEQSREPGEPFAQLGGDIMGQSISHPMPLHLRPDASYRLRACNMLGCRNSTVVPVASSMAEAVGYFKASNTDSNDFFGYDVALSADGHTLAVSALGEDSNATGVDGDQTNDSAAESGAAYVFVQDGVGAWSQQAYVKASNSGSNDQFGHRIALSADGNTLAVGASAEDSSATGINGNQADDSVTNSGAVYVFTRDGMGSWSQQAYVKASNSGQNDSFGYSVALSGDGHTLAVSAAYESSSATGIDGNQADDSLPASGAVYVFTRDGMGAWSQQAYVKASNTGENDWFGYSVALSEDGHTLAVGANQEASSATGIDGDQANDALPFSGAVYVYARDVMTMQWSQQAYVKASNTDLGDWFGYSVALSADGNTLAVGAEQEDSGALDVDGDESDNGTVRAGAAYVFTRDTMTTQWSQQAYVKASNSGQDDFFGDDLALSADGNILAVGARNENSNATGINGDQVDDTVFGAGAVYVLTRDPMTMQWSPQAYVKAPNPQWSWFGFRLALSADGLELAAGARVESSGATGIGGNQNNNGAVNSGAVYLY